MMRCFRLAAFFILACLVLWAPRPAAAACFVCTCATSASGVNFGAYNPLLPTANDSTGNVRVTCSTFGVLGFVSYTVTLSTGGSGTYSVRRMSFGGNTLDYNLYRNSSRTTVWGNGTGGSSLVSDSFLIPAGPGVSRDYTVYGRLPGSQSVPAGTYFDTIVVTVTY